MTFFVFNYFLCGGFVLAYTHLVMAPEKAWLLITREGAGPSLVVFAVCVLLWPLVLLYGIHVVLTHPTLNRVIHLILILVVVSLLMLLTSTGRSAPVKHQQRWAPVCLTPCMFV